MASDDNLFSAAPDAPGDTDSPAPAESATPPRKAAKRAPRKATKKAQAPVATASPEQPDGSADGDSVEPAKTAAKRVPRKATKKASTAATAAPRKRAAKKSAAADEGAAPEPSAAQADRDDRPPAPAVGVLFQAPDPVAPRRRRAASAPAGPATHAEPGEAAGHDSAPAPDATPKHAGSSDDDGNGPADDDSGSGGRKRRRRGGKGRKGRPGGDDATESGDSSGHASDEAGSSGSDSGSSGDSQQDHGDDEHGEGDGGSRRRRRRRRSGGSGGQDDPPGTVTKVREPRKDRDEVTSVKGSTRLEAKKQRRREGREAGRRRTIITEAEFLARRESVERVMVVRHRDDRTQIGVLEDDVLVEHYISREVNASMAGNVYLGKVQNVLPSMEAAFIDIGRGRNAVLYAGEVNWDAAGMDGKPKRIEHALKSGESVLVQVTKDPIGHKGARLTSQVSLPGRYLVYVPGNSMTGISRKLPDTERARLKKLLREIVPDNAGVIVRTAAEGASEAELRADVERLTAAWDDIQGKANSAHSPSLIHGEPDLTVRVIRDVFNEDFSSLVVSGEPAWEQVSDYVGRVAPDLADRLTKWTGEQDLFAHYRVDEQLAKAMDRKVWLPSGGSLVIDRTEAMTVVDVNTGKFVGSGGNLEETVTKNNIEAAEEIVRQLRLRDIGGIIVVDFIDMVLESNRDLVVRRLLECLGRDRTKHQVAEVTSLGLVQMTRKRVGAGLIEVFSEPCEHCNGRGIVVHTEPVDDHHDSSDQGSSRGRRGRGGAKGGKGTGNGRQDTAQAPEPSGPTPAQIAAAAHAAAAKAAGAQDADATEAATPVASDPQTATPLAGEPESATPVAAELDTDAVPEPALAVTAPVEPVEPVETVPEPVQRPRRKRGRVVAPAGPPPPADPENV
jgi:ribonuclease E